MRKAIYPGSFNDWHKGHEDILLKALKIFDEVEVIQLINPEKFEGTTKPWWRFQERMDELMREHPNLKGYSIAGAFKTLKEAVDYLKADAVIRGLRDGDDLAYERRQQYWNEDIGIEIPFVYFVADRKYNHVSSSAIRSVEKLGFKHNY